MLIDPDPAFVAPSERDDRVAVDDAYPPDVPLELDDWDRADDFDPPDALTLVLDSATMLAGAAADRLVRIDAMHRELIAEAAHRGAGVRDIVERSIRLELAAGMRITEYAAGRLLRQAEALVQRYPRALDSLWHGRITEDHAAILVDLVDQVEPALRDRVVDQAVALAEAEPVGRFRRALQALIDTVRSATLEERHEEAVQRRRVGVDRGEDGMSTFWLHGPDVEMSAIYGRVTAMGKAIVGRDGETRTLDQARADVVSDLLIDGTTENMPAAVSGIRATVVVTVPVLSLLEGEPSDSADPPVVEGLGPIPISRARELCGGDAKWMRVLTHPETGMVLSVGRRRYEAPAALRKLVAWRADRCMAPGCGMPASRCEIDHQVAWADGGETRLDNHAPFCKNHHIVKHHGGWSVRQIEGTGGSIEWISPTGRRYVVHPERRVPVFTASGRGDPGADPPPF